jgi:hypothetical protein
VPDTQVDSRPRLPGRRYVLFAVAAAVLSFVLVLSGLLVVDLYLHRRAERSAGLNVWGYRGEVVGRKQPGEVRIAFLGGSTMFGYGVTWDEALPAVVERQLNEPPPAGSPPVRSVNLAMNNEGAYSFLYTLQDFEFLDYDVAVLYEGYNDKMGDDDGGNRSLYRHDSAVFRLTGYYPILPLVLSERAMMLRYGGDLNAAYEATRGGEGKTIFRPGLASRSAASALDAAASVGESLGRQLDRLSAGGPRAVDDATEAGCAPPWSLYCQSVYVAVQHVLGQGKRVAVVSQPLPLGPLGTTHLDQQRALADMLRRHFEGRCASAARRSPRGDRPVERRHLVRRNAPDGRRQPEPGRRARRQAAAPRAGGAWCPAVTASSLPGDRVARPRWRLAAMLCASAAVLGTVAWLSPPPRHITDRGTYEATAARGIVPDCQDLHCFRVLVAWTLGVVPGPSALKWKAYAAVANAAAAVAVFQLALTLGLSRRGAALAAALSALGFGSLYTLHDPYTSDPLMYALGPIVTLALLHGRVALAGVIGSIGVLAKEFVAAPLYMFAAVAWIEGRRELGLRALAAANAAFLVWLSLQLTLIVGFNYGYGDNPSTRLARTIREREHRPPVRDLRDPPQARFSAGGPGRAGGLVRVRDRGHRDRMAGWRLRARAALCLARTIREREHRPPSGLRLRPDSRAFAQGEPGRRLERRAERGVAESGVWVLTGYVPALPLVLEEKGRFVADAGARRVGALVAAAGRTLRGADRRLHGALVASSPLGETDRTEALTRAVDAALEIARGVVVILPPPQSPAEDAAHARIRKALVDRVQTEARLRLVDLAATPAPGDSGLLRNGVDFDAAVHAWVADVVAPSVVDVMQRELTK